MADLPPLRTLRTFWYVAEHRSFKVAAEHLFVTQTAVSHQIRQLEDHLGVSLFERGHRALKVTREGQRLLPYVQQGFTALQAGVSLVRDEENPHEITLSAVPAFAARWLVPHLGSFQQRHPGYSLKLIADAALESFASGETDLALRYGAGHYAGLHSELLLRDSLLLVASPDWLQSHQPELEDVGSLVVMENPESSDDSWTAWLAQQGLSGKRAPSPLTVADDGLLLEAALAGQGPVLARRSLAQTLMDQGRLERVFDLEMDATQGYYLVAPEAHFVRAKVRLFVRWLKEEVRGSFGPEKVAYHGA